MRWKVNRLVAVPDSIIRAPPPSATFPTGHSATTVFWASELVADSAGTRTNPEIAPAAAGTGTAAGSAAAGSGAATSTAQAAARTATRPVRHRPPRGRAVPRADVALPIDVMARSRRPRRGGTPP